MTQGTQRPIPPNFRFPSPFGRGFCRPSVRPANTNILAFVKTLLVSFFLFFRILLLFSYSRERPHLSRRVLQHFQGQAGHPFTLPPDHSNPYPCPRPVNRRRPPSHLTTENPISLPQALFPSPISLPRPFDKLHK